MKSPLNLRVEHHPSGATARVGSGRPRLSWRLPAGAGRQEAYRWRAGDWTSPWPNPASSNSP
ncbi:hypothetical protein [Actinoplanes aureus]|uniref:Uncharacterized protein n=1 Tax=Actinoplanes aureus TaxID=2792083 RepID=A0A931G0W0_9ACTN|nr:hypothetical protein [Actinoplanes aureus]MBG0564481.1 hypothetical protein [Actinoplanes aureus]